MWLKLKKKLTDTKQLFLYKADKNEGCKSYKLSHLETGFWPFEIQTMLDESVLHNCNDKL